MPGGLEYFNDLEFYKRDDIATRLEKLGVAKGSVRQIKVDKEEVGLFGSASLKRVTLLNAFDQPLGMLLAIIRTAEQEKKGVYITKEIKNIEEDIIYRTENLKFQESLGLLTPLFIHHEALKEVTKVIHYEALKGVTKGKQEEQLYVLLLNYWEGPSADMDVIALRNAIHLRKKKLNSDNFITCKDKERYSSEIKTLEDVLKDEIVLNALDTMVEFSTKTTDTVENNNFKLPNTKVKIEVVEDPFNFYISKRERQFKAMLYWNLVNRGERGIEEILMEGKDIKSLVADKWDTFNELVKPLSDYMFVEGKNVYSQGDQHLHHFKRVKLRDSDKTRMGLFDMGSVRMEDPIFGASRLLASHLLGFNRAQIKDVYAKGYSDFVAKFKPGVDKRKLELAFELCTLIETMWGASRRANDNLYNKEVYEAKAGLLGEKSRYYKNTLFPLIGLGSIELPTYVDYRLFNPPTAIASSKRCVGDIMQGLRSDITSYYGEPNLEDHLKKLEEFLEKNIIETKIE